MAKKYGSDPITSNDLQEYINAQDDFALELFVYSKAKELGFTVSHGGTYVDPITSKPRQYDVRASKVIGDKRIDFAIECKSLKPSYPLLVSCIPRTLAESFHQIVYSYKRSESSKLLNQLEPSAKTIMINDINHLYPIGKPVGKSTVQVGRAGGSDFVVGDADVYDKWTQALGSASELIQLSVNHYKDAPNNFMLTIVLPILVVANDTLWVADYSEDGLIKGVPQKMDSAELYVDRNYWERMGVSYAVSHLHFFTRSGIDAFFTKISTDAEVFNSLFPMEEIKRKIRKP